MCAAEGDNIPVTITRYNTVTGFRWKHLTNTLTSKYNMTLKTGNC